MYVRADPAREVIESPRCPATHVVFDRNSHTPAPDPGVITSGWTLMGKFDGEFGRGTQTPRHRRSPGHGGSV
jgi:hypothetical protein